MRVSVVISAFIAAVVGVGSALAIVLAGAKAVGASPVESASWVTGLCLAMAASSIWLSVRYRLPIITAWSTPGAALLAVSGGIADIQSAVGAFLFVAVLIMITAVLRPVATFVERIPTSVAAAMLGGVLLQFVISVVSHASNDISLVLPLVAAFLVIRLWSPSWAVIAVLVLGIGLSLWLGEVSSLNGVITVTTVTPIMPRFDPFVLVSIGLPLYLVTMASQNLPGLAVLKSAGYENLPTRSILGVTGLASFLTAPIGAHTTNLAAITAALCAGPDAHPDPTQRWMTGPAYGAIYIGFAVAGASLVALFDALPSALIATVAGLALAAPLAGAVGTAMAVPRDRFAAVMTFAVTASGVDFAGIGSPFWGLVVGLVIVALEAMKRRSDGSA